MADDREREDVRDLVARGRAHYNAREYPEAVACLTEVLREQAAYADVYDMLGVIYHHEGRLADAETMFEQALRINPSYTEAALNLVVTCNDLGKYAAARDIYERAIAACRRSPRELDPFVKGKLANMHAEIGAAYRAAGLHDDAVREYERALALGPRFADLRTALGDTRREMGDAAGAVRELERVRAESPRFVTGRLHLGLAYHAAGRRDDAAAEWREVLAIAPDNRTAPMYLKLLDPGPTPAPAPAGGDAS